MVKFDVLRHFYKFSKFLVVGRTLRPTPTSDQLSAIFEKFPDPESMAATDFDTLFPIIRSISYPNNKTKHLIGMANMLIKDFNGEVPMTVDELIKLPGVGRKTANVITSVIDQQPNMAVDTHVFRVSARLGLTRAAKTPLADPAWQVYLPCQEPKMW